MGFFILFLLSACAGPGKIANDYYAATQKLIDENSARYSGNDQPTNIIFLVDGLSESLLQKALDRGTIPNLAKFFRTSPGAKLQRARSVFPSETYPNIMSLLMQRPVSQHGLIANKFISGGALLNLESLSAQSVMQGPLERDSVFARLDQQGRGTITLSEAFRFGARIPGPLRISDGLTYFIQMFYDIDENAVDQLKEILTRDSGDWPDLIFIHLVGIDGLSHRYGPDHPSVFEYLTTLDKILKPALERLDQSPRMVRSLLASDHGFAGDIPRSNFGVNLAQQERIDVIVSARYLQVHFLEHPSAELKTIRAQRWSANPDVELVALAINGENQFSIFQQGQRVDVIRWQVDASCRLSPLRLQSQRYGTHCAQHFVESSRVDDRTYALPAFADFFRTGGRPEALVLAADRVRFADGNRGHHGGITPAEMITPVLGRGLHFDSGILPIERLLDFIATP